MFIRSVMIPVLLMAAGCASGVGEPLELSPSHPASPKASEAAYQSPPNVLGGAPSFSGEPSPTPSSPGGAKAASPVKVESVSAETRKSLDQIFKSYEEIRALLAADKLEGIAEIAGVLVGLATQAAQSGPEPLRPDLKGIAEQAEGLKHAQHLLLDGTRKVFGELSRHALRVGASVPALAQDRKVFKCLMWDKGFSKWIQTGPTAANPYTGKEMLECGNPSDWKE